MNAFWIALLLLISSPALANSHTPQNSAKLEACPSLERVERKGRVHCWVQMEQICLSQSQWQNWLMRPQSSSLCGEWKGHWQIFSPLENSLSSDIFHTDPGHEKKRIHRFIAEQLPRTHQTKTSYFFEIEKLREELSLILTPHDRLGIFRQLLLNEKVPESPGDTLRILGFVHLLTVTGIHLYALSRFSGQVMLWLCLLFRLPSRVGLPLSRLIAVLSWLFAWLLAGARRGMLRPLIIVSLRGVAKYLGLRWRKWTPLILSLCLDISWALFTHSLFGPSFSARILYALAVGGGMLGGSNHIQVALYSWILTALWDAWHHQVFSPLTPLLSLITIPYFTIVLYPPILIEAGIHLFFSHSFTKLSIDLLRFTDQAMLKLLHILLKFPMIWHIPQSALLIGIALAPFILCWEKSKRFLCWSFILLLGLRFMIALQSLPIKSKGTQRRAQRIEQIDVGQGDAALIVSNDQNIGMIDVGPKKALSDSAWISFFLERGITHLDWIALTHLDQDHVGSIFHLASLIPIRCVTTSEAELQTDRGLALAQFLHKHSIAVQTLPSLLDHLGQSDSREIPNCFPFQALSPSPNLALKKRRQANAHMSSFLIPLDPQGFYLSTGDASTQDENRIAMWISHLLDSDKTLDGKIRILKVGHHGSHTSSSSQFLKTVQPSEAWISVGTGNRYGHPSVQTLNTLKSLFIPVTRTDQNGLIPWNSKQLDFRTISTILF